MTSLNSNLHGAKRAKNDEFYTRLEDVEAELVHYENHFRDKTVYLNCDDQSSAFWQYFSERFDDLGLRRLAATKYPEGLQFRQDRDKGLQVIQLTGDGDFRSDECVELLKQADIVVTNPPFSLFREYVAQLVEYGKKFLVIGNMNAVTYREIWPRIQGGGLWLGVKHPKRFQVPDDAPRRASQGVNPLGKREQQFGNIGWFTNLDHTRRHAELPLVRKYTPDEYPTYDNYDAINVNKVKEIPVDYDGVMGVPITFLDKFNPDQFEIVGLDSDDPSEWVGCGPRVNGRAKYRRIFVKRKAR